MRALIEFSLRTGDLGGARDFARPDRALAGTRGHIQIQRSRPAEYQKEVPVVHDEVADDFTLRIRGRIDGLLVRANDVLLEEIKTVEGGWDHKADPLHWAQAKFYGFIYARDHGLEKITLQLTYLDLQTDAVTEFREVFSIAKLSTFFNETTAVYLEWIREQIQWQRRRDASIESLVFPFLDYRAGQRQIAVSTYKLIAQGGRLFIEAPTGIGKTISVIFAAVKALGEGKLERFFYLTARTIGRTVAEKAMTDLRNAGLQVRTITLTAKDKLCLRDGQPCDQPDCPLALGYYDRRKPAMREALGRAEITRPVLEEIAAKHQVCPFELSLDLSSWVDGVICDYNYVFDPRVYLRRHFADEPGDYAFLVDEAHNLVDRAREMFSAEISTEQLPGLSRAIKAALPDCTRALRKLNTAIKKLAGDTGPQESPVEESGEGDLFSQPKKTGNPNPQKTVTQFQDREDVRTSREFPASLNPLIEDALHHAGTWLALNKPAEFREDLLQLYFRLHSFRRTAELYDERYVTLIYPGDPVRVRLFCLDPSFLLQQAFQRGKAAVLFSATLAPIDYYRELLGGRPEDPVLQLESPFPPDHLAVLVHDRIRTHFKARGESLLEVVRAIAALVLEHPGNYLVYFPSFQYLNAVREQFQALHPTVPVLVQRTGMAESEREAFLAAFSTEQGSTLLGFAVLGGIFGEGIDLVGDRLIGAIIVGVGLPQLSVERDLIRDYFQEKAGAGFDYAYAFPGMNRVLQATGRVIRSETDRGVVLLLDTRFAERRYRQMFPKWWQGLRVTNDHQIRQAVHTFWNNSEVTDADF